MSSGILRLRLVKQVELSDRCAAYSGEFFFEKVGTRPRQRRRVRLPRVARLPASIRSIRPARPAREPFANGATVRVALSMTDESRDVEEPFAVLFVRAKALSVRRFTAADRTGSVAAGCALGFSSGNDSDLPTLADAVGRYIGFLEEELSALRQLLDAHDIPAAADDHYRGQLIDRRAELAAVRLASRTLFRRFQSNDGKVEAMRALTWIAAGSPANFPTDPDR